MPGILNLGRFNQIKSILAGELTLAFDTKKNDLVLRHRYKAHTTTLTRLHLNRKMLPVFKSKVKVKEDNGPLFTAQFGSSKSMAAVKTIEKPQEGWDA